VHPLDGTVFLNPYVRDLRAVQIQAISDVNGPAQFNGPYNTVPLTAETNITSITLENPNAGALSVCTTQLQGNSCSTSTDIALGAVESIRKGEVFARLKKETDFGFLSKTSLGKVKRQPNY
jgi:hypothetical protein